MKTADVVLKGDICWSTSADSLAMRKDAFLVCVKGKSAGVFSKLPDVFAGIPFHDYTGKLIVPGLVDLHIHAPQFPLRATGMDLELLGWLKKYIFPEEARYASLAYAEKAYSIFVNHLKRGFTTRAVIFATLHTESTLLLMDLLEASGLVSYTGKVNMDRNCPGYLTEKSAAESLDDTVNWLTRCEERGYVNTMPILTPRFIPACSNELMRGLATLQREYRLPVQSHLSENRAEVAWVRELCPSSRNYGEAYAGFFNTAGPAVMAHCVWLDENEIQLLAEHGVFVAHCPQSNMNLASGIAPVRRFLEAGVPVGLGSDLAAGAYSSIFQAAASAIQVSKLRGALALSAASEERPLSPEEAFYLATAGGGAFFGKTGSFEPDYECDILVIDDDLPAVTTEKPSLRERLERLIYLADEYQLVAKYVRGYRIGGAPHLTA